MALKVSKNAMKLITFGKIHKRGSEGRGVSLIQEWLCLHGFNIAIDGDFGPATEYAARRFQRRKKLKEDGIVGRKTFAKLVEPMKSVLRPVALRTRSLSRTIVAHARQHEREHPREIGGQNRGPWVRLYMNGIEGREARWCAGFVCFIIRQACESLGLSLPLKPSFSCDVIARRADRKHLFFRGSGVKHKDIRPGFLFLTRKKANDWTHTGIVIRAADEKLITIEGNTNDGGHHDGYEVVERTRGYKKQDFVVMPD